MHSRPNMKLPESACIFAICLRTARSCWQRQAASVEVSVLEDPDYEVAVDYGQTFNEPAKAS